MARSLTAIKSSIKTKARTFSSLDGLLFSNDAGAIQGSIFISLIETFATAHLLTEQIADVIKQDIEAIAEAAPSGNAAWLRRQVLAFQNGDIIQIDPETFVPAYATVDETKQIISRCSVVFNTITGQVDVKVAKNEPPEALTAAELANLIDYYYGSGSQQGIGFAGVVAEITSDDPDRIFIEGEIIHYGGYSAADVKANVISAINAFLADFSEVNFDGTLKMQELEAAILAVDGVSRFEFAAVNPIRVRDAATAFGSATPIDEDGKYQTVAGYIIEEDTASQTFDDKITISEET